MPLRPATDRDLGAVAALGIAEEAAWFGAPEVGPDEVAEWIDGEGGVTSGVVAVGDDGTVRGFTAPGRHAAVLLADPAHLDATADELLPWLLARPGTHELITYGADVERTSAFERHGLRHIRSSFTLARPPDAPSLPDPVFPDGVDVAAYRLGDDDAAVHRLVYVDAAWGSVPGHPVRDLDDWRSLVGPCTSLALAWRDGRPVGFVAARVLGYGRGYVSQLAVATGERGRGIGRGLLLHAFAELLRAGASALTLDASARNESALGLYRSVGLEVEREWRIYAPDG